MKLAPYKRDDLYPNRKRLSSSQFSDFASNPQNFLLKHAMFDGGGVRQIVTKPMMLGRIFHAMYQYRNADWWPEALKAKCSRRMFDQVTEAIKLLPKLPVRNCEYELIAEHRGWEFRATLDGFVPKQHEIVENKTGQMEWTQRRVSLDDQLTFQAWCHWKKYGTPPRAIYLNWIPTKCNPPKLVVPFQTSRTVRELKRFEKLVDVVIDRIEAGDFTSPVYK